MKIYTVGGAVRDELLGVPVQDRDYVVVGATPEEMVKLGYKPVGRDFPVFLHPESKEEYALARTERKTARGYHGFEFRAAPDVTLEQDLERRDLTINALAKDEQGRIIDPFHGTRDLEAGVLRHVSPAFAEDPVRVLRVARFAARFAFAIAPETLDLMRKMAENGEVDALVPERVWQELARGLMEREPSRLFEVLHECAALPRILPEMELLYEEPAAAAESMRLLDLAAGEGRKLEVRIAVLARSCDPLAIESLAERIKLPAACRDLALLAARHTNLIVDAQELDAAELLELLDSTDAWRRPERFADLVDAALVGEPHAAAVRSHLEAAQRAAATVNAGEIARQVKTPAEIRPRIDGARLAAIRAALEKRGS
jgi:tRNA nucleotidyltransferase (CCA-adding enzyme)